MGSDAYLLVDRAPSGALLLEVGTGRWSTPQLARFAEARGTALFTVDPNSQALLWAAEFRAAVPVLARAEAWLPPMRYLAFGFPWRDGSDWPYPDLLPGYERDVRLRYEELGLEYSAEASAASHLAIARALAPMLVPGAVVVFDDTWFGDWGGPDLDGKGRDAVPYLLGQGLALFDDVPDGPGPQGYVALVVP